MMSIKVVCAVLVTGAFMTGCGSSDSDGDLSDVKVEKKLALTKEQKVANEYLSGMDNLASVLSNVNDEASAEKAAAEIRKISDKMNALAEDYGEDIGKTQMAAIMVSRSKEFMAVQQRVASQMARIGMSNPALMKSISKEMQSLPGS